MKKVCLSVAFIIALCSCKKNFISNDDSQKAITSFSFLAKNNPKLGADIICSIEGDTISASLPAGISTDSLTASFTTSDAVAKITVNSVVQVSGVTMNNYQTTTVYTIENKDNTTETWTLVLQRFTGLPIIYITTDGNAAVTSKYTYVNGYVSIDSNGTSFNGFSGGDMEIKLHGNSTLMFPKLPYKIKLSSKASLLGMPADKEWILLANYSDKTLMRNAVAFKESEMFGLPYTPRSQFAEVFLNGVFEGNYQLTEEIKIATNRVNIREMDDDDVSGSNLTGGYLLEFDQKHDSTDVWFPLNSGLAVTIHDPDDNITAQNDYIQNYMQQTEDAVFSDNFKDPATGYAAYINSETLIKWYWVNELMKNNDAIFYTSVWMYKDENNILNFGPVWDFDISAGNINYDNNDDPDGWWVNTTPWLQRLFQDTVFTQKTIAEWNETRPSLDSLYGFIDNTASYLNYSQKQNFTAWPILNTYVWPNSEVAGSYEGEVAFLKSWLQKRIAWIDANLQTLQK